MRWCRQRAVIASSLCGWAHTASQRSSGRYTCAERNRLGVPEEDRAAPTRQDGDCQSHVARFRAPAAGRCGKQQRHARKRQRHEVDAAGQVAQPIEDVLRRQGRDFRGQRLIGFRAPSLLGERLRQQAAAQAPA